MTHSAVLQRHWEYLVALGREGHFGRAAAVCHVTQPALSAGIRRLEAELDVQIVRRGQRFEGFTPEGERVLFWARRVLAERETLRQELDDMRAGLSGVLHVGAIPTALTAVSVLTVPLHRQHPGIRFSLESLSSQEIVHRLVEFDLDAGLTYVDGEPLGAVRAIPLYRERYLLLTPEDSDFADQPVVTWADAARLPLCMLSTVMQNRRILDQHFADAGAAVDPIVETDTVSALYDHVESLHASSVIAHAWLHVFGVPAGMRVVPLQRPRLAHHVGLVIADRDPQPLVVRALLQEATRSDLDRRLTDLARRHLPPPAPRIETVGPSPTEP